MTPYSYSSLLESLQEYHFALLGILLKTSITMMKRKGKRGSSCLRLLVALNHPLAFPFTNTSKFIEYKNPVIYNLHLVINPFLPMHGQDMPNLYDHRSFQNQFWRPQLPSLNFFSHPPFHWLSIPCPKFISP